MAKGLSEDDLKALVANEMRQSLGYLSSKLSIARQRAEYYYLGLAIGDLAPPEVDGRSTVVSTDVRDTIEAMLPQLMVTFCGGDEVVEFEAQGPEDETKARQATEYVNYLFYKKNNGHRIAYTWMKDALLQKNGIVKVWWDTRFEEKREEYRGCNDVALAQILEDEEVSVIEQNSYPDEEDAKQRAKAIEQLTAQLQQARQAAQQGNAQAVQATIQIQAQLDNIAQQPVKVLYDVVCKRVPTEGKVSIENVPPEEFLIARNAKDIQTARFVGHRVQRTISELKSMGYKNLDNISGEDQAQAVNMERIQRLSQNDENAYLSDNISNDPSQRSVWVMEAYVRADYDGDGISELRKVTMAGNEMLDNEEVDFCPFVSITPVPLPHVFYGLSIADLAMEIQRERTGVRRALNDNLYLDVNGRYFAVEGQVNLDDLLTSRPGGVVRIKSRDAVGRLDQGRGDMGFAANMLETLQQDLENRTGWSRQSMGNDAAGVKQTATAANIVTNKADMRVDLIARNFAEGFTELFKYILKLVSQHQNKAAQVKLSGGWTPIDPREWRNQFDVNVNVGIGMGNKDQKVQHLMLMGQAQTMGLQVGFATPENLYNASAEMAKVLGYRNADKFFTDPAKNKNPPPPNPEMIKLQGQMQIEQMKGQQEAQLHAMRCQHDMQVEQARMQMQERVDGNRQEMEARQKTLETQQKAQVDAMQAQHQRDIESARIASQERIAALNARAQIITTKITAKARDDDGEADLEAPEIDGPTKTQVLVGSMGQMHAAHTQALVAALENLSQIMAAVPDGIRQGVSEAMARPKTIVRGPDGRAVGVQ